MSTPSAEATTAATDALLAIATVAGILYLRRTALQSDRRTIWLSALGCIAATSTLGAITHGLPLSDTLRGLLWQPLYLLLGGLIALFVLGAVADWRGAATARRLIPAMLGLVVAFYLLTVVMHGAFWVFVGFETGALLFTGATYAGLAVTRHLPGATLM
ncbi:MAG: DUF6962 family protein, partial [Gemmatimonadales bacterium]